MPVVLANRWPLRIGADSSGGSRFLGCIRRVQVYDRALSPVEVEAVAQGTTARPDIAAALVADWQPGEMHDNRVASGHGDRLSAQVIGHCRACDGPGGRALELAGDGFLEVAPDPALDLATGGTLCAWICPRQHAAGGGRIVDKCTVGAADGYVLDLHPGNTVRLITTRATLHADAELQPDQWVHVAATISAEGELALYVDGHRTAARAVAPEAQQVADLDQRIARLRQFHAEPDRSRPGRVL